MPNKGNARLEAVNIQIFGTKKCNDTKKAERFFKERGIKYQFVDMKEKGRKASGGRLFCADRSGAETEQGRVQLSCTGKRRDR